MSKKNKKNKEKKKSCDVLFAWIVPDTLTSVCSIISSLGPLLFSLGAVPKLPIFRKAASSCICLLCPWHPCSAYLILHSPPHFALHNTCLFSYCQERLCVWILQVQRSKQRIPMEIKNWENESRDKESLKSPQVSIFRCLSSLCLCVLLQP